MAKKLKTCITTVLVMALLVTGICFAETGITKERVAITNSLPDVTLYLDTDMDYGMNMENTRVFVNDSETDLQSVETFAETGEGAAYFALIDISRSIAEEEFELIKRSLVEFVEKLSSNDRVYVIPFGESVYLDKTPYVPGAENLKAVIENLELKDDYTQLYSAIDSVIGIVESEKRNGLPKRKISMIFTDGMDDTTGGLITKEEAISKMNDEGIPLYAFAVGNDKEGKDNLGVLARGIGGTLVELNESNSYFVFEDFNTVMDKSIVVRTKVRNSEDIADSFTVRILLNNEELVAIDNVRAHKTGDSKDVFAVTAKKFILAYWWVFMVVAIAMIALFVLLAIRKNNGIINIDGKVVYGSKIQRKYHIQVKEHNSKELKFDISINGGEEFEQPIQLLESIIVGRARICDVSVDDINMSRQHFSLELVDGQLYVNDLESTGGTFLNGIKLQSRQRIRSGDFVNAGRTKIRISFK